MTDWIKDVLGENAATEQKELVDYVTSKGYKTPADAIKAGHEAHKLNTRKTEELRADVEKQFIPSDNWTDDQWKAYAEKMRPKDKTAYKMEIPKELEQYFPKEEVEDMIGFIHESGLPARQANGILKKYMDGQAVKIQKLLTETEKIKADDKAALEKEWGANFKKNDELSKRGQDFSAKAAGMEAGPFGELLKAYGMDTHPAFKKMFRYIGELSNDPQFVRGVETPKKEVQKTTGQLIIEDLQGTTK